MSTWSLCFLCFELDALAGSPDVSQIDFLGLNNMNFSMIYIRFKHTLLSVIKHDVPTNTSQWQCWSILSSLYPCRLFGMKRRSAPEPTKLQSLGMSRKRCPEKWLVGLDLHLLNTFCLEMKLKRLHGRHLLAQEVLLPDSVRGFLAMKRKSSLLVDREALGVNLHLTMRACSLQQQFWTCPGVASRCFNKQLFWKKLPSKASLQVKNVLMIIPKGVRMQWHRKIHLLPRVRLWMLDVWSLYPRTPAANAPSLHLYQLPFDYCVSFYLLLVKVSLHHAVLIWCQLCPDVPRCFEDVLPNMHQRGMPQVCGKFLELLKMWARFIWY